MEWARDLMHVLLIALGKFIERIHMKEARFLLVVFVCLIGGCLPENAAETTTVAPRQAETVDPEELGIWKYIFETKVPVGKVMVLRKTEERDGRKDEVHETIQYTNGDVAKQVVLVYDLYSFPFADGKQKKVRVRAQAGEQIFFDSTCDKRSTSPSRLVLEITTKDKDKVRLIYECFVEDHETAKTRVPGLPKISRFETWTYQQLFKEK